MRVILVGAGAVGVRLLRNLSGKGHEVVVIEADRELADRLAEEFDALVLHGDGTDPQILEKAQLRQADALVATTGSDALNTVIAMLGERAGVGRIVVKLTGEGLRPACQEIGVTEIIAPAITAAARIERVLAGAGEIDLSGVTQAGYVLVEAEVEGPEGVTVQDLKLPEAAHPVAVRRDGTVLLPRPLLSLRPGDVVLVLAEATVAPEVRDAVREGG